MTDAHKHASQQDEPPEKQKAASSTAEWIVAAIGLVITVGSIGFTFYQALTSSGTPPLIYVLTNAIEDFPTGYVVTVTAKNTGATTGAAVTIEGTLKSGNQTIETSTATISYVPGHSERRAGLVFTQDPRQYTLELRAKGYERP